MDRGEFEALIARTEAFATRDPKAYRRRVLGLAAFGYLYLALVVLILLALLAAVFASLMRLEAVAINLSVVVGAPLLRVLRALWVRPEPPSGMALSRKESPELFVILDDLRRRLHTPRLHRVLLTPDFSASITQTSRLRLFGWYRNYLVIGLPLMKALTIEQFRSVLAHELAHLSRGHTGSGNWICRLQLIWQRLNQAFSESGHWGSVLIRPFFKRYIPYFAATSFPLTRLNEYEADATAVRLTSARSTAQALTAVNIVDAYLREKYWPTIHAAAKDAPQPAFAPYSAFAAHAVRGISRKVLRSWLDAALARKTSTADTHPCLTDRLKAIGAEAEFVLPMPGKGADALLGPSRSRRDTAFDARWRELVAQSRKEIPKRTQVQRAPAIWARHPSR